MISSSLQPNTNYTYTIKAQWLENGQSVRRQREVAFQASQGLTVDFREAAPEKAPAPALKTPLRN